MKKVISGVGGFLKKHKKGVIAVIVIAVIGIVLFGCPKDESKKYSTDTAKLRDIANYNSYVGTVEYDNEKNIVIKANAQVSEVFVEIGDSVSKGDVIAVLDSETLEKNISKTELAIKTQKVANEHTIADAQRAYDDLKYALDNGLNATLNNVKFQKENAEDALEKLWESYDDYMEALDVEPRSDAVDYLLSVKKKYDDAVKHYERIKETVEDKQKEISESETVSPDDELELSSYVEAMNSSKAKLDIASDNFRQTLENYCDVHDPALKKIVDGIEDAETACKNAMAAYDSVKLQLDQQLVTLESTVNKLKDTLSLESMEKDLEMLKDSLEDYTVTAPCDGVVTMLMLKEGDMSVAGQIVATVSELDKLEISIRVDEYSILGATEGKDVQIYIDSIDRVYAGTIEWIADKATVENGVSYFLSTVEFVSDEYVRGGMSVEVRLVRAESQQAISVLASAVDYRDDNSAFVLVKDSKGEFVEKDVVLGVSDGIYVEIVEGISEGDIIYYVPGNGMFMIPEMEVGNVNKTQQ
ncbi:MAG: efflux RND transporter periplasmic adaptor subunit [Clostridia bacterium]|nr:efflux RND transporter periplasmic adaptor subunit [Clostridia bacterium]